MNMPLKVALIAALSATTAAPAFAQYQPTPQYQNDQSRYQDQRADYRDAQANYADRSADYQAARRDYDRQVADYERARADYDNRYGYGAYARSHPAPAWDSARWDNDRGPGYSGGGGGYSDPCRERPRNNNNAVAGGLIGALAGAALGSNVAAGGVRTEGAVLGALVGGGIGAAVGNAHSNYQSAKCDEAGYYFSYADTQPYREASYDRRARSGRYDYSYYNRQRCRLAVAPAQWGGREDYRYVRVCPDRQGRYRITG
jgi:hypothetical protein